MEQDIIKRILANLPPVESPKPKSDKTKIAIIMLCCTAMFLCFGFIFLEKLFVATPVVVPAITKNYATSEEFSKISGQIEELKRDFGKWQYRLWLLAVANNENASNRNNPITFSDNWKLNRMPNSMSFDAEQEKQIRESVK